MKKLPILYKLDSKGKTREWTICSDANEFWSAQGIVGMKIRQNNPTVCEGKNIGRSNETTPEEQAELEAQAKWEKKRKDGYTQDIDQVKQKKFYEPMLAQDFKKREKELAYPLYSQPKLDGVRCIIRKEGDKIIARTRKGRVIDSIPHISEGLQGFFLAYPDSILDGELYNHEYRNNFNAIISLVRKQKPVRTKTDSDESFDKKEKAWKKALLQSAGKVEYWVYDSPRIDFLRENHYFTVRRAHLEEHLGHVSNKSIQLLETSEAWSKQALDANYEDYLGREFEGQIIRQDESYESKRSKYLLKRKEFQDAEYKVLDIEEGNGNRQGTAKHLACFCEKTQKTFNSNIKGTFEYLKEILENKEDYIGKYATIKFFQLTPDGIPRFPYAIAFRDYE